MKTTLGQGRVASLSHVCVCVSLCVCVCMSVLACTGVIYACVDSS